MQRVCRAVTETSAGSLVETTVIRPNDKASKVSAITTDEKSNVVLLFTNSNIKSKSGAGRQENVMNSLIFLSVVAHLMPYFKAQASDAPPIHLLNNDAIDKQFSNQFKYELSPDQPMDWKPFREGKKTHGFS